MRIIRRTTPILAAASVALLAACGTAEGGDTAAASSDGEGDGPTIGVSVVTTTRGFHTEVYDGMKSVADEKGVNLVTRDAEENVVQQLDDVNSLLQQNLDGLIVVPTDEAGAVPAYEAADAAGVPVINVTRDADTDLRVAYVGAEWASYGEQIAQWTCENVEGPAKIAMVKGPAGASHVDDMATGYIDTLASECADHEVVFQVNAQTDGAEPGVALTQDALAAYPDLDVIYVNADDTAMGVIQALTEQGKVDDVVVTGFNGEPDAFEAIKEGTMDMTFALRPYRWGQIAMESMLAHLDGEELPDLVPIETVMVDKANIGDFSEDELR